MERIQRKLHRIWTYNVCKISSSSFDDKRYLLDDGINSLANFHKDIRSQQNWVKLIELIKSIESVELIRLIGLLESNQVNKKFTVFAYF